jgi:hypothetical protein
MHAVSNAERDAVRSNIERVLSDIFSAKYDCKVNLRLVPRNPQGRESA